MSRERLCRDCFAADEGLVHDGSVLTPTDIAHICNATARNRRNSRRCVTTGEGLDPALAPQQILRAHPTAAALGLFFLAGGELLGRRSGVLCPRGRDGRRRVGARPRTSPAFGWAPRLRGWGPRLRGCGPRRGNRGRRVVYRLRARLPLASPAYGGHRAGGVRRRPH